MASATVKPPPAPPPSGGSPKDGGAAGGLGRAAVILMAATLLSRLLGMVRDIVIAHQLGVSVQTDAYVAAFKVPDLLMYLIAGGALSSTFIPVFKEYLHNNNLRGAWQTFSVVATVTIVLASLFVIIAEIFTPEFIRLLNPGYDAVRVAMTVPLTRIVLPAQIFFMLGGLMMGTLNARNQFLIPALAPSIYNIGIIFGAVFLFPHNLGGLGLPGLMWGALMGAIVGNFALQLVPLSTMGVRYRPSLAIFHPGAVKVWRLMGPILLGVSLPNVDQIINGYFASELSLGSQSALTFAVRIMLIPIGVFAQAMGIAILPTLSGYAAAGQTKELRTAINRGMRTILFLTIPASALLVLLAKLVVAALLQGGHFNDSGTLLTASALRFYSIGIFAWSAQAILTRAFYAMQDSKVPVISGTIMTVLFILMNWFVVHHTHMDVSGLALATTIAAILHMLVMYVILRIRLHGLQDARLFGSVLQTLIATSALCLTAWIVQALVRGALDDVSTKLAAIAALVAAGPIGLAVFVKVARALGMEEIVSAESMMGPLTRMLGRGKKTKEGPMIRVLFVCLGNICRSPMAEAVFQHKVRLAGLAEQIESDSAGTDAWHIGEPPHHGTADILRRHGITYSHQGRQITAADLDQFDYIVTMDNSNLRAVEQIGTGRAVVAPLMSYAAHADVTEVPDPFFHGNFDGVYHLINEATDGLMAAIRAKHDF